MIFTRRLRRNALKLEGERSTALDLARGRLVLMSVFFVAVYFVFAIRAFDLSIIQGRAISPEGAMPQVGAVTSGLEDVEGIWRANITDRNGELLATTLKVASLYADSHLISDPKAAAEGLVKIFPGLSYGDVLQELQSGKGFVWIERGVSPEQQYQVLQLGEPGLAFKYEYQRFYPQGALMSHLVGYTDIDGLGKVGIERSFDNYLRQNGDLKLTLDVRLQHVLRREAQAAMDEFDGRAAAGVIMDVTNGDILAGVSLPDFNPHKVEDYSKKRNKDGKKDGPMFNRLTLGAYELGSVFKIFSTAAFFEANDVPMGTKFDASEPLKVGGFTIRDYHAEDRILTVPEVFMYSSNIGTGLMAQATGKEKLRGFYTDLGLLDPLDFEIREVVRPRVPNPWGEASTVTASYGHGLSTTPIQVVSGVSSIVNGGYLIRPRLVMGDQAQNVKGADVRIASAKTAQRMRQLLRLVVTDGTGRNADVKGYRVGGKTGTADKASDGGYDEDARISSFVGVFPMDAPRYAVFIMVDEPKGQKHTYNYATGGWVGAPAVARVIQSMVSILGVPPVHEDGPENQFGANLKKYVSAKGKR